MLVLVGAVVLFLCSHWWFPVMKSSSGVRASIRVLWWSLVLFLVGSAVLFLVLPLVVSRDEK